MTRHLSPEDYDRLFASLRNLVDQAEEAYRSGVPELARHATANLSFATSLIHASLGRTRLTRSGRPEASLP